MNYRLLTTLIASLVLFIVMVNPTGAATNFNDIGDEHRAAKEIAFLNEGGIVHGFSKTHFSPSSQVTRAQAAMFIGRSLDLNGEQATTSFKDVGSGNAASGYINQMSQRGIINGYPDGTFKPNQPVSRGEMAVLMNRAFGYGAKTSSQASNNLISLGISQGMADGTFGMDKTIIRADFSVFLARAINAEFRTTDSAKFSEEMTVNTNDLNYRVGPSVKFAAQYKLHSGTKVKGAYSIGSWVYVKHGENTGFVHEAYLNRLSLPDDGTLKAQTLVIDPGHGGSDSGAVSGGLVEKVINLETSLYLRDYLKDTPITVKMTRETDVFPQLHERVTFAKRNNADLFISIHANAFNGSANGTETYYYGAANQNTQSSRALAIYIQKRLLTSWGLADRGAKHGNYHVLRENDMTAVLVELGFLDANQDRPKLGSSFWRKEAAKAIYLGVLDYYTHYEGKNVASYYSKVNASPSPRLH